MHTVLSRCPVCQADLDITRLHCRTCDTTVEGQFTPGPFAVLNSEQAAFVELFLRCEGKLNRMEKELSLSYPTIRKNLHEVIRALGYEPLSGETDADEEALTEADRQQILEDLHQGKITAEEAMKILAG